MTTASVQDVDAFIRLQKEKLGRDRFQNPYLPPGGGLPPNIDYNRQLDDYLRLQRNFVNLNNQLPGQIYEHQQQQIPQNYYQPQQLQYNQEQTQSPPSPQPPPPQQQSRTQNNAPSSSKQNNQNDADNNFFQKFGQYDAKKNQLKNDLHQEYNEFLQNKKNKYPKNQRNNKQETSSDYYATLPLGGMDSKDRNRTQRNSNNNNNNSYNNENQSMPSFTKTSERRNFQKSKGDDLDIKPYSNTSGSQENVTNIKNSPFSSEARSKSTYDISSMEKRVKFDLGQPEPYMNRPMSQNSYETMRVAQQQMAPQMYRPQQLSYQPQQPSYQAPSDYNVSIDPSLSDILRRPPVGYKSAGFAVNTNRYNDYAEPQAPFVPPIQTNPDPYQYAAQSSYPAPNSYQPMNKQNQPNYSTQPQQQQHGFKQPGNDGPFNFEGDKIKDSKAQKMKEYQEELNRQVREKQMAKQKEKEQMERLDRKIEIESSMYNPYGKGGGGAPIRDRDGNIMADLKQVKTDPEKYSPREMRSQRDMMQQMNHMSLSNEPQYQPPPQQQQYQQQQQQQLNTGRKEQKAGEEASFARGGNGIFGEAKSNDQKKTEEKYKDELRRQIEEKKRLKAEEEAKRKLEDERLEARVIAAQEKLKQEAEEEERKKKAKEESGRRIAEETKRVTDELKKDAPVRKFNRPNNKSEAQRAKTPQQQAAASFAPTEFRSNSPPVPAAAKKIGANENSSNSAAPNPAPSNNLNRNKPPNAKQKQKPQGDSLPNYYVTESRLNLASPTKNEKIEKPAPVVEEEEGAAQRAPSALVSDYTNAEYKPQNKPKQKRVNNLNSAPESDRVVNSKPPPNKTFEREPSQLSNNEVLTRLQDLRKHLKNEQMQVEFELQNSKNKATVGQLSDIHQSILNVKTPPGDKDVFYSALHKEPARIRREPSDTLRTYRKEIETPPINGGFEPRTYFRENTVLLGHQRNNNKLQRQADERQFNRMNMINLQTKYDTDELAAQNQQRLKKLRDLEGDDFSLADPNEVLNKFLNRNNRRPSAATLNDDTWMRQPA